ncbi:D-isomer specific 2-hydroxyacid dehydrogenase NAD-binding [Penicillium taxi]|uniref:D-isomer specific 2-hydroxyacid dehydrogenase NAD-binding n=1 Tax=Penicillium taxi TaxID=168475 RepID=UPI0025456087|nr:D-isomer specific 2-hydroxyacid dehydrogenase NAD-binding [Penicillium taxi]KAJ5900011.1 D-isomer specific 2-hydroxyacid dehydrogenase NAD-binding [Penicillium taxi]
MPSRIKLHESQECSGQSQYTDGNMGDAPLFDERILITYNLPFPDALCRDIRRKFRDCEVIFAQSRPEEGVHVPSESYRRATILVSLQHLPDLKDAKHLKLIHTFSAGLDHLMSHPVLKASNVPITNSSGLGAPIGEWVVMNWLIHARNYHRTYRAQRAHIWDTRLPYVVGSHDQIGKRVGILGYGSIGRHIARISQAMGMTVHAYTASPRLTPESRRDNGYILTGTGDPEGSIPVSWHHGTDKASIHAFLSSGLDHLVVSLPLTPQTTNLIGADELAILSDNCRHPMIKPFLTNISRGKILDQDALIGALELGLLSGAALDVADPEPLPAEHPLWDAPNIQISPHVSGMGQEYFPRALDILKFNLDRMKQGLPLVNEYKRGRAY